MTNPFLTWPDAEGIAAIRQAVAIRDNTPAAEWFTTQKNPPMTAEEFLGVVNSQIDEAVQTGYPTHEDLFGEAFPEDPPPPADKAKAKAKTKRAPSGKSKARNTQPKQVEV